MNAPNRFESFVLDEGEKPVEVIEDTKIPNAATIKVVKQDHTLGNLIRAELLTMPQVLFAGYKVPHPLQPYFLIKIQTDGSMTPSALIVLVNNLEGKFKREFSFKDAESGAPEDAYGAPVPASGRWQTGGDRDYLDF
ncbi:DNA-directed RNA polymerase [Fomitopsis serialis]|uniref:DNA-directed RNA polymerase n=1 Tax=Fomitopsis serialis TaxID=139415 RepID=UPI00200749FF|nr:DNA-directed RNA polymerase [Neoantrodia serialis]KAH9933060.1 DNA-directed RNA polymerase [Neoantrodia serialis]